MYARVILCKSNAEFFAVKTANLPMIIEVRGMNYFEFFSNRKALGDDGTARSLAAIIPREYYFLSAFVFIIITIITIVALERTPAKFRATTNLLVLLSDEYGTRPIANNNTVSQQSAMDRDAYISAETDILMSNAVVDEAIQKIGPTTLYPEIGRKPGIIRSLINMMGGFISGFTDTQDASDTMMSQLAHRAVEKSFRVDSGRSGNVIGVSYENTDRDIAARFLSAVIDAYFARRSRLFADEQAAILARQVEAKSNELEQARAALDAFQQKNSIFDFGLQRESLLKRFGDLSVDLQVADLNTAEVQARRKTVLDQLNLLPADSVRVSNGQEVVVRRGTFAEILQKEVYRLDQEVSAASVRHQALETQLGSVQNELQAFRELEAELENLKLRHSLLERQYAQIVQTLDARRSVEAVAEARHSNVKLVDTPNARPSDHSKITDCSSRLDACPVCGLRHSGSWLVFARAESQKRPGFTAQNRSAGRRDFGFI
jgi:hypothetical protein